MEEKRVEGSKQEQGERDKNENGELTGLWEGAIEWKLKKNEERRPGIFLKHVKISENWILLKRRLFSSLKLNFKFISFALVNKLHSPSWANYRML